MRGSRGGRHSRHDHACQQQGRGLIAPNPRRIDAKLDALYAQVPDVPECDGSCYGSCCFAEASIRERQRIERAAGHKLETIDRAQEYAIGGGVAPIAHDGRLLPRFTCSMLDDSGRCTQYSLRPMVCLLPDAWVYTASGPERIGSILAGDKVYGRDGRLRSVLATASRLHTGSVRNVRPSGSHASCWSTLDHRWLTAAQKDKRKRPSASWVNAGDLIPKRNKDYGHYLLFPRQFEDVQPARHLLVSDYIGGRVEGDELTPFTRGVHSDRVQHPLPLHLPITDEFLFMLGLYLAEGSASIQTALFTMSEAEVQHLRRVRSYLKSIGLPCVIEVRRRRSTAVLRIDSALFARLLTALCGRLAATKAVAGGLFRSLSHAQKWEVFKGWNVGDGRKCFREREFSVTTASERLALQMQFTAFANGVFARLYRNKSPNRVHASWDVHIFPLAWKPGFRGTRNMEDDNYVYTPLANRTAGDLTEFRDYRGPVVDIQVADGESFVTTSGIVHNCRLYGATEGLECHRGCKPILTAADGMALMAESIKVGGAPDRIEFDPEVVRAGLSDPDTADQFGSLMEMLRAKGNKEINRGSTR